jgi:DNA-binding IclR family transcriptional regulator
VDESVEEPPRLVGADRVLAVLIELGEHPQGATLDELAHALRSPKSTVHRALVALRKAGLAAQVGRGAYMLGDEFLRIAFRNISDRPDAVIMGPRLERLSQLFGETVHYAVLDGTDVVYRAKTDPPGSTVRLTSVIGGRNPAYRTAVGKLLLSYAIDSRDALEALVGAAPLESQTSHTITDVSELWEQLRLSRERGFAVDDQENEVGVNCVAVPVHLDGRAQPTGAVSVSALAFRTPLSDLVARAAEIAALAQGETAPSGQ